MVNYKIKEGLFTTFEKKTSSGDAYISNSSTIDYLLSTPAILSMIIDASCKLLDPLLPEEYITVGKNLELSHEHPTLIGESIKVTITVVKVMNNTIYLEFEGNDLHGVFCRGKYERAIVNRERLMEIAYHRSDM